MTLNQPPIPLHDPIAQPRREEFRNRRDPLEGHLSGPWIDWFGHLIQQVAQAPSRIKSVSLTGQSASIAATDMSGGALSAGLYRLTYYTRITTPAGTSSSLTITLDWTDGGVPQTFSGAALTGNTTTSYQTETLLVRSDSATPVRYSTAYASTPQGMEYSLYVTLEQVLA